MKPIISGDAQLAAVQAVMEAYRWHVLDDPAIDNERLTSLLETALTLVMGEDGFDLWRTEIKGRLCEALEDLND